VWANLSLTTDVISSFPVWHFICTRRGNRGDRPNTAGT